MTPQEKAAGLWTRAASKKHTHGHSNQFSETSHPTPWMTPGRRRREAEISRATRSEALRLAEHYLRDAVHHSVTDTISRLRQEFACHAVVRTEALNCSSQRERQVLFSLRVTLQHPAWRYWSNQLQICIAHSLMPGLMAAKKVLPSLGALECESRVGCLLARLVAIDVETKTVSWRERRLLPLQEMVVPLLDELDQLVRDILNDLERCGASS